MFERVDSITGGMSAGFVVTGAAAVPIAPGTPVQFAAIDPGLLASINEVQRLNALATMAGKSGAAAAMISERDEHHLRAHVAERATRQVDKLTIELVGMLFDRIHQDKHLPAEIKTALIDALGRDGADKLSDLVGVDAAAMTAEIWPA